MGYYDYKDLIKIFNETKSYNDLLNLYYWFCEFGMCFWNGECFQADDFEIYPVYEKMNLVDLIVK